MNKLIILGAGEFGRELYAWVQSSPKFRTEYGIDSIYFLDDAPGSKKAPSPILGPIRGHKPEDGSYYVCAIGTPATREHLVKPLEEAGAKFATFVHDSVLIGAGLTIGEGSIICPGNILTVDIRIGKHVHVNLSCSIGHDVVIGDYATLSPACNLTGWVTLEPRVFLGTGVTVIPSKRIGENSRIGAGSVVLRSIKSGVSAFGNPCRVF